MLLLASGGGSGPLVVGVLALALPLEDLKGGQEALCLGKSMIFHMSKSLVIAPIDCSATNFDSPDEDDKDESDARVSTSSA